MFFAFGIFKSCNHSEKFSHEHNVAINMVGTSIFTTENSDWNVRK